MKLPRPQFSLLALLIFMGLVGVIAKLWHGPHTISMTVEEAEQQFGQLPEPLFPGTKIKFDYQRNFDGTRTIIGPWEVSAPQIKYELIHVPDDKMKWDMPGNHLLIAEGPGTEKTISLTLGAIYHDQTRIPLRTPFLYDHGQCECYFADEQSNYWCWGIYREASVSYIQNIVKPMTAAEFEKVKESRLVW
jgi:hypothetical protein